MNASRHLGFPISALVLFSVLAFISNAAGQTPPTSQKQLDLAAARAARKATVGENMHLTDQESAAFWPVYEEYEAKMDQIDDRHVKEIKDYAEKYDKLTNADAAKKLTEVLEIQQSSLHVQKDYVAKFAKVMSAIKVTRFYQIDNKLRALVQCDIAQMVPLAHAPSEAK